jgi:hypothetical protein
MHPKTRKKVSIDRAIADLFEPRLFISFISTRVHDYFTVFHLSIGFTIAQLGPPSLPVPGIVACNNRFGLSITELIVSQVIPSSGILIRRCYLLSECSADFAITIWMNLPVGGSCEIGPEKLDGPLSRLPLTMMVHSRATSLAFDRWTEMDLKDEPERHNAF